MKITYKGKVIKEIPEWRIRKRKMSNGAEIFYPQKAQKEVSKSLLDFYNQTGNDELLYHSIGEFSTLEEAKSHIKSIEDKQIVSTEFIPYP